jgi:energy-coupling factor transport system permease protein
LTTTSADPIGVFQPAWLEPRAPTGFHGLNPLTKLVLATVTAIDAVIMGGLVGPLALLLLVVLAPAAWAGVAGRLIRLAFLLSLPLAISTLLINVFFFPGGQDVLLTIGPITATREGLVFALEMLVRILTFSGAIILFYLTTRTADLVLDLERRGVSRRLGFVIDSSVQVVPAMVERAAVITAAQRARGLDTEGSIRKRIRGPVVMGAIGEVEERTMALEARGFTRPGRRTLLWSPRDTPLERVLRWVLALTIPFLLVARAAGLLTGIG